MKKLSITPEKLEVVKKTITTAIPGKTKGGVPLEPKARIKFYEDEIKRHGDLLKQYPEIHGPDGKLTKEGLANSKKADQIIKNRDFLMGQLSSFKNKLKETAESAIQTKRMEEFKKQQANKPLLEKIADQFKKTGGGI